MDVEQEQAKTQQAEEEARQRVFQAEAYRRMNEERERLRIENLQAFRRRKVLCTPVSLPARKIVSCVYARTCSCVYICDDVGATATEITLEDYIVVIVGGQISRFGAIFACLHLRLRLHRDARARLTQWACKSSRLFVN